MATKIPQRSLQDAINSIVGRIYNGNDPNALAEVRQLVNRGIVEGPNSIAEPLKRYITSGSDYIQNDINDIRNNEYKFYSHPEQYVQNVLGQYNGKDFNNLTNEELSAALQDYQNISNIPSIQPLSTRTITSGGNTNYDFVPLNFTNGDGSYKPPDVTSNINTIQDLLSTRKTQADKEAALQQYLNQDLPNALTARREDFLSGESARALSDFQQNVVPQVSKEANVRGLYDSGYVPTTLTARAVDTQSDLDSLRASVESQDYSFLADAAYQNKVRQLLQGQTDYRSALLNEQNQQLTDQNNRFTGAQNDLTRQQQLKMQQQNYYLQLQQQQADFRRQNEQYQKHQTGGLFGQLGGALGSLGGAVVGGPAGAVVGSQLGSGLGSAAGSTTKG